MRRRGDRAVPPWNWHPSGTPRRPSGGAHVFDPAYGADLRTGRGGSWDRSDSGSVTGTLANMVSRWRGAPQPVRVAAALVVVVLTYGTVAHVVDLLSSGFNPYTEAPMRLRTYWVALTVADPVAAVLLA